MRRVFITGGTGMIGRHLIVALLRRQHEVKALVRPGSEKKLPPGCKAIVGDALQRDSFEPSIAPADTFVHLVGISHPSPFHANQFRDIDLVSVQKAAAAARAAGVKHFIYLSVAQPSPIMQSYIEARQEGEKAIRQTGMNATFIRPWYVLGPGRKWPLIFLPLYRLAQAIPALQPAAKRLAFVTIDEMIRTLLDAVEVPPEGVRIVDVPTIRAGPGSIRVK